MSRQASSTLSDILRVNHAGELGAIRIYEGQLIWARLHALDLLPWLRRTLSDERCHKSAFASLMLNRSIRPCWMLNAWGMGGWLLGLITGGLGRSAILVSTIAIERTVHCHMQDQLVWLADRDMEVSSAIRAIAVEEAEHLESATQGRPGSDRVMRILDSAVAGATETLIWLSTYGASARMAKDIVDLG